MELMDPHAADPKPARGEEGEPTPFLFDELDLRLFWIRCVASMFCADPLRIANHNLKMLSYAIDMLVVMLVEYRLTAPNLAIVLPTPPQPTPF